MSLHGWSDTNTRRDRMTSIKLGTFSVVRPAGNGLMTEQVVTQVRDMIHQGKLKPGDRLPPERELAKRLGISRASLRAGLHFLAAIGVLTARHGSGSYIATGPPALDSAPLSMLAALHGFTADKMFEARRLVEVAVAGRCGRTPAGRSPGRNFRGRDGAVGGAE